MPEITVSERCDGWRLDRLVREALPGMPLSHIFKLFRTGKVRLDGKKAPASTRVAPGQMVIIHVPERRFAEDAAAAAPGRRPGRVVPPFALDVAYEDEEMIAINKPAGVPVHPGSGYAGGTCIDRVLEHLGHVRSAETFTPALLHRLDADTSGVLLTAKTYRTLRVLSKAFAARRVRKTYLALAAGARLPDRGVIDLPVRRLDGPPRPYKEVTGVTEYRVVARADPAVAARGWPIDVALLEIVILTGRTHQIRSHLKSVGAPVVGDTTYGDPDVNETAEREAGLARQFLHARSVALAHPITGKELEISAPLPEDLRRTLDALGLPA